ncbi:mitochondrial potassium channel ATP-binding subunit-like [Oratosquilla oratoria]|uniref:mitochondrial potassium channel ATP-binding subunit-like n=1 Tax=Oratosquilla oratoria TaxID=337810 RepID=UPI003F76385A
MSMLFNICWRSIASKKCTQSVPQLLHHHLPLHGSLRKVALQPSKFVHGTVCKIKSNGKSEARPLKFLLKLSLGGVALTGAKAFSLRLTAHCEASQQPNNALSFEHDRLEGTIPETKDPKFDWLRFWELLKPQLGNFLAAVLSALVVALANIKIPLLLGDVVNVVAKFTEEAGNEARNFAQEISGPAFKIIKLYVVQAVFTFSYITFLTRMGERIASDLRQELFNALVVQDIAFYDKHKTGELVNRLTADVQDFKSSFKMCISQGMRSVTQVIGCGISIYTISPQMAGMTALVVPAIIGVGTALGTLLRALSKAAQHQVAKATGVADECLGNMRTVRAFAMEPAEAQLFSREVEKSRELNEMLGTGIGLFQAGSNLFLNGIVMATLYAGGSLLSSGQLKAGDLMSFMVAAQTIQRSLAQLSIMFGNFVRGISAGARVFEYISIDPSIPVKGGKIIPYHSLMGHIEFRNISFSYPSRPNQDVLTNFNLRIPAGRVVALVGASGGGKSTIAQLMERFYDTTKGQITIDGQDIKTLDPSWLRGRVIGFINQEPVLFATSILENIRYGRPNATDEEVQEAARQANAHNFISSFPEGYSTVVGERGVTVSGGQKQRIAIARALLKNPNILILDEATSALDAESEAVVQEALEKCVVGRTVLIIAHRLSTVQNADVIAVMAKGKLVELGTHEGLKKLGGVYASLIKQQQQEEQLEKRKTWGH